MQSVSVLEQDVKDVNLVKGTLNPHHSFLTWGDKKQAIRNDVDNTQICPNQREHHNKDNVDIDHWIEPNCCPFETSLCDEEEIITKRNLIVNYLPQTFTDIDLYNMFIPFGALDSVRIMKDSKTGYSFGFGFVNFLKEEEAVIAQQTMNGFQISSKKIKVSCARPPSDDIKDTNLYITNLPRDISEDKLVNIFNPFGPIIQKKLLRDKYTNLPRGVAFIRYERRGQASRAIMALNNTTPGSCSEPIRIRLAEDHGKQKAAYLAGFQAGMFVPRTQEPMEKWKMTKSRSRSKSQKVYTRH